MLKLEILHKKSKIFEDCLKSGDIFEDCLKSGDLETLKSLNIKYEDIMNYQGYYFIIVSGQGNLDVLKYFEKKGCGFEELSSCNYAAFVAACQKSNFHILKYLELKGFQKKHIQRYKNDIINFSENYKKPEILEYLKSRNFI